jgi:hypothetical protein
MKRYKKHIYIVLLLLYKNTITKDHAQAVNETHYGYEKTCQQCTHTLSDARKQIADLEKRLHLMQEDLRKWMKAYSDEVAAKGSFYEKVLGDLTDMYNKYVSTEIKLANKK